MITLCAIDVRQLNGKINYSNSSSGIHNDKTTIKYKYLQNVTKCPVFKARDLLDIFMYFA